MKVWIFRWVCVIGIGTALSGCAMFGNDIPSEQMAKLATIEPGSGLTFHSIDGQLRVSMGAVHIEPGAHLLEMTVACYNNQCIYRKYRFTAEAGMLYRVMPGQKILVLDRNDKYQRKLDELLPMGGSGIDYGTRAARTEYTQRVVLQKQAERQALLEERRRNIPLMQQPGRRVCITQGDVTFAGYVESFTEEKLQIRIAEAHMKYNPQFAPADFKPHIVWDSPLNWDLCE